MLYEVQYDGEQKVKRFSPCLSEPAVKISPKAPAPLLLKPPCPRRASLPALTEPASQTRFFGGANSPHESRLRQRRRRQRAAGAAAEKPADAADSEPAGTGLARRAGEQERERWASLLRPAAGQGRAERAHLQPNKPLADAESE